MRPERDKATSRAALPERTTRQRQQRRAAVASAVKRLPLPAGLRRRLHETLPWRPGVQDIPVDRLLLGLQNRMRADEFAGEYGDLSWPSTPVGEGPHAELLHLASVHGRLGDDAILASSYGRMARVCIRTRGFFFTATDDEGIIEVARNYIGRHRGEVVAALGEHQSPRGAPIRVAPIRWSDCYQVLDGHHRVASASVRGEASLTARVKWAPVTTPLQRLLIQMTPGGQRALRQPVGAPEVRGWDHLETFDTTVHQLDAMVHYLSSRGIFPEPRTTYLDLGSVYGWAVAEMAARGYCAEGVENHPAAGPLAEAAYRLPPNGVHAGDPRRFLEEEGCTWDVISWFGAPLADQAASDALLARLAVCAKRALVVPDGGKRVTHLLRQSFDDVTELDVPGPSVRTQGRRLIACSRSGDGPAAA